MNGAYSKLPIKTHLVNRNSGKYTCNQLELEKVGGCLRAVDFSLNQASVDTRTLNLEELFESSYPRETLIVKYLVKDHRENKD